MHEKIIKEIDLNDIPVEALSPRTVGKLGCMLNKPKLIPSPEPLCLPRDYRGIAHLMQLSLIEGWLGPNPVEKLLKHGSEIKLTLGQFQSYFEKIDRYDVLEDTLRMFHDDAVEYENRKTSLVQPCVLDQSLGSDKNILTLDDIIRHRKGNGPQMYDAFILYVDADGPFAISVVNKLEKEFGLKICDKDRDLIAGLTFEHSAIMKLISERCYRLLVILSEEFVRSDRHTFFVKYAQAITYEQGHRKVVPCVYKSCELPFEYRSYVTLDFNRNSEFGNFWNKLHASILPLNYIEQMKANDHESKGVIIEDITLEEKSTFKELSKGIDTLLEKDHMSKLALNTQPSSLPENGAVKNEVILNSVDKPKPRTIKKKIQLMLSNVKIRTKKPKKKQIACAV